MRKNTFLIIVCLLLLASCKSSENINNTPMITPEFTATPAIAPTVMPTIAPEPTVEPAPSPEKNALWAEAYADYLMQGDNPPYFLLIDVDFDSVPELFSYTSGYGANMWVVSILRFSANGLEKTDITDEIPAQFELYEDKQTGETRWMMVMDSFRSSFSHYHYEWAWIDFDDFPDIRTELFFKWGFEFDETDAVTDEHDVSYYLYKNADEMAEVEYEDIERRQTELFSKYELIETRKLYAYADDFARNNDAENLDRELIVEFLLRWK